MEKMPVILSDDILLWSFLSKSIEYFGRCYTRYKGEKKKKIQVLKVMGYVTRKEGHVPLYRVHKQCTMAFLSLHKTSALALALMCVRRKSTAWSIPKSYASNLYVC